MEWTAQAAARQHRGDARTRRERVTLAGRAFECLVLSTVNVTTYVPTSNDGPSFPPAVRVVTDGEVTLELQRIE
jgi:hypothetical protein